MPLKYIYLFSFMIAVLIKLCSFWTIGFSSNLLFLELKQQFIKKLVYWKIVPNSLLDLPSVSMVYNSHTLLQYVDRIVCLWHSIHWAMAKARGFEIHQRTNDLLEYVPVLKTKQTKKQVAWRQESLGLFSLCRLILSPKCIICRPECADDLLTLLAL